MKRICILFTFFFRSVGEYEKAAVSLPFDLRGGWTRSEMHLGRSNQPITLR